MNKNVLAVLVVLAILVVAGYFIYQNYEEKKKWERLCFALPRTGDASVFGPYYWDAMHTLANRVPCSICRGYAEKFMVFFHDTVNAKLGKPLHDEANFKFFTQLFADMNRGVDVWAEGYVPGA